MLQRMIVAGLCASLIAALGVTTRLVAATSDTRMADAAMQGDRTAVATLLQQGLDVNVAQGDGMTALHWAATKDDVEMARMLIAAGANAKATTRLGAYTPLLLASRNGSASMMAILLTAGADANAGTTTGTTPLMLAAVSGNAAAVQLVLDHGADINAKESGLGQTALMFAAAYNRSAAIALLMARGADAKVATTVVDVAAQQTAGRAAGRGGRGGRGGAGAAASGQTAANGAGAATSAASGQTPPSAGAAGGASGAGQGTPTSGPPGQPAAGGAGAGARGPRAGGAAGGQAQGNNGDDSRPAVIDFQGGLTPLLFAARQGHLEAVRALLDAGADINGVSPGDKTSPLLIATINGHFDVAMFLLARGADPNLASTANATPLYAALNVQYAPHAFYPQPSPRQEKTTHLELMTALLEQHANPNVRLRNKLWYTGYNFDQSGVDAKGSTPFWRAAQAADVDAMKLLLAHGADPTITSDSAGVGFRQPNGRGGGAAAAPARVADKVIAGVTPLQMASGAGYDGNFQVIAPGGFLPALKYLVEELHADVNEADYRGFTALHNAAFRGDNEMILYLVSNGAKVWVETKAGDTAVDMANGPVQRIQPFPETIALLEKMGVTNHHRCVSCG